ncbi:MAG: hypothetical protein K9K63_04845 [Desulfotignum sp.]|nr:hypothetical protein [Desulfotignum sp.]MCF8089545.1 hypothetical protein [Desulfotignum sp.]MCF8136619.1 hypothetical protein [Desulfotignum sp.]
MPLSFESHSHGPLAFGFFNIESDMLLLDRYFFFCDDFCDWIATLAEQESSAFLDCEVFHIKKEQDIGDLMGAIHDIRFTGFIGRVYQQFPFPKNPSGFRQNPEGGESRQLINELIAPFSKIQAVEIGADGSGFFRFGPYEFTRNVCHELIRYVWQGGYPRWKEDIRPACVIAMADRINQGRNRYFSGVFA